MAWDKSQTLFPAIQTSMAFDRSFTNCQKIVDREVEVPTATVIEVSECQPSKHKPTSSDTTSQILSYGLWVYYVPPHRLC